MRYTRRPEFKRYYERKTFQEVANQAVDSGFIHYAVHQAKLDIKEQKATQSMAYLYDAVVTVQAHDTVSTSLKQQRRIALDVKESKIARAIQTQLEFEAKRLEAARALLGIQRDDQ